MWRIFARDYKIEVSECCWFGGGERQPRYHLVAWALQRRRMLKGIGKARERKQEYVRGLKGD